MITVVAPRSMQNRSNFALIMDSRTHIVLPNGDSITGSSQAAMRQRRELADRYVQFLEDFYSQASSNAVTRARTGGIIAALTPRRRAPTPAVQYARGRAMRIGGRMYWVQLRVEDVPQGRGPRGATGVSPFAIIRARVYPARRTGSGSGARWARAPNAAELTRAEKRRLSTTLLGG
ncbi:TPA: hypothetical protein EYP38_00615 [Candidatus Micrarchaeota archaeon]|nr:hypothetical protein [Candidatus Micrarchaeota archaeon]